NLNEKKQFFNDTNKLIAHKCFVNKYNVIDTNIFLSMVLLMIIGVISLKKREASFSTRIFSAICWSTILILSIDTVNWFTDGKEGSLAYWLTYLSNFLVFLFEPLPLLLWLCYVDFQLNKSFERIKKRCFYCHPFVFTLCLMIFSIFTDFVFSVDSNNVYHRGPGFLVLTANFILCIIFSFYLVFKNRKTSNKRTVRVLSFFGVIPIAATTFQALFYGINAIWPAVAIAVIFAYIFLETQREIRDYLTGLLNREQIDSIIQSRINEHNRKGCFTILMIDMDGFKKINDIYGHKEGDQALIMLSTILNNSLKSTDKIARFGGDEFLVMLEECETETIEKIIARLYKKLDEINSVNGKPYDIAFSTGYTIYSPNKYHNFTELIHEADQNMYEIKKKRKEEKPILVR
ncbi:MAG: GGDEF domain-containing protein, partial [Spirochaetales bacterium]|nr:GGDEF domain-containing protein [Spirochaetales bacterium]